MTKPKDATTRASRIILSATAQRHAAKQGQADAVAGIELSENCAVGDLVSIGDMEFIISRRRWLTASGQPALEIILDYPARSALR